jgi:hypothetical protein
MNDLLSICDIDEKEFDDSPFLRRIERMAPVGITKKAIHSTSNDDDYSKQIDRLPDELEAHAKEWIKRNWLEEWLYFDSKAVQAKAHANRLSLIWRYGTKLSVILATCNVIPGTPFWDISVAVSTVLLLVITMYAGETREQYQPHLKWHIHRDSAERLMDEWRGFSVMEGEYANHETWSIAFGVFHKKVSSILRSNREAGFKIEGKANKVDR